MSESQEIADCLSRSENAIAFTGPGISTESGIPDFRSPGGIWANSQPVYFQDFLASADSRYEYWRQKKLDNSQYLDKPDRAARSQVFRAKPRLPG